METAVETIQPSEIMQRQSTPALRAGDADAAKAYLASLAETGRRTMRSRLEHVAELMTGSRDLAAAPWSQLRYEHVVAIRTKMQERGLSPASVNATLAALRGVARAAWNMGLMAGEDYQRATSVKSVRGERLPAGRALTSGELAALMDVCVEDDTLAGIRDGALIAILYCALLRRSEVAALEFGDYNQETGALRVRGKGNKERMVYATNGAADALADWLAARGDAPGPLFYPIRKGGKLPEHPRHMTDQAVYNVLAKRAEQSGVSSFSPHDLRRTCIGDLLDNGIDLVTVQHLAGHANVTTTARYDRRGEQVKAKAAETIHIPYRRRKKV